MTVVSIIVIGFVSIVIICLWYAITIIYVPVFFNRKNAQERFKRVAARYYRWRKPDPYDLMTELIESGQISPWARKWGKSRMINMINELYDKEGWSKQLNDPLLEKWLEQSEGEH